MVTNHGQVEQLPIREFCSFFLHNLVWLLRRSFLEKDRISKPPLSLDEAMYLHPDNRMYMAVILSPP